MSSLLNRLTTQEHDPTDAVLVLRSHLEELDLLMDRIHGYFMAIDLADGYRSGKSAPQYSKLTNGVRNHAGRIKGYLNDESVSE